MNDKCKIEIAVTTASDYIMPVVVLLKSLFENNKDIHIIVNLLYLFSKTKEKDVDFLENYILQHGHSCRKVGVEDAELNMVSDEGRYSKDTYLRLLLPDILPPEVSGVLYLDGDIIVNDSIDYFARLNMDDKYIAGVKDTMNFFMPEHCKNLGLQDCAYYINAGVVYMNLYLMRKERITSRFLEYLNKYSNVIFANDQDILNGVLWKKTMYISPRYNRNFLVEPDVARTVWGKEELVEAKRNPAIIHYIGPIKPWNYLSFHPKTKLWWKYLKMTPFKDFKPRNKSFGNFFKKYYLKTIKTIDFSLTVAFKRKMGKLMPETLKRKIKKLKAQR
jgi:lipopolysaccharide biosynthesis glycosyltransferase